MRRYKLQRAKCDLTTQQAFGLVLVKHCLKVSGVVYGRKSGSFCADKDGFDHCDKSCSFCADQDGFDNLGKSGSLCAC